MWLFIVINTVLNANRIICHGSLSLILKNKKGAWATVAFPSLLPSTRKSSGKLCYLIWAFCAMYAVYRDLVGRLCKHSVTGSTHVYLLKHQSHTEAVKETRHTPTAQRTKWERTCGIASKCNQSSANQTIKWKACGGWVCHIWKSTNEGLLK